MAVIRSISLLGSKILRKKAIPVKKFNDPKIKNLIDDLMITVEDSNGVGISAPQIYESESIFIISSKPNDRYPKAPTMEPTAVINPEILSHSTEQEKDWEGCLSIPGIRGFVPRWKTIKVRYYNAQGKKIERSFSGFVARIFQHEFDHLNGILFIDRTKSNDLISEKEYKKIMSKSK